MHDYKELIVRLISASERNSNSLNTRSTCKDAADAIEQLLKERNAAVADLKEINLCHWCYNNNKHIIGKSKETQADIDLGECGQRGGLFHQLTLSGKRSWCENFVWRGVQEEKE